MNTSALSKLAAVVALLGALLSSTAWAQDDLAEAERLNKQVLELHWQGRFADAIGPAQRALAIREKELGREHPDVATSLSSLASAYDGTHRYALALPLQQRALAIREKALGPEHPDTVQSLKDLAWTYKSIGDNAQGLALRQRVLAIQEKALGPEHPDTVRSLKDLAWTYKSMGEYVQALPLFQRALAIQEKALGPEHRTVIEFLNGLAELHESAGQHAQALPLYQRVLKIREKYGGPEHPNLVWTLDSMAALYEATGQYAQALPLYERALAIHEKALGLDDPKTARSLNRLAALHHTTGQYALALPLYQRVLAIREKACPDRPDTAGSPSDLAELAKAMPEFQRALAIIEDGQCVEYPNRATTLDNLAQMFRLTGQHAQALPLYQRALAIRERVRGLEHPDTATSLGNLAGLYLATGQYAQALPLYQRAMLIYEKVLGSEHPNTATSLNNLAALYDSTGQYAQALPLHQRALAITENALGPEHRGTANSLNNMALLYYSTGRYALALPLYQRALAIYEKSMGPEHPDTARSLNNLAALYDSTGQYAQALPLAQRALAIREKALGPEHPDTATSLNNLAALYKSTGQYAEALSLTQRALAIREKALGPEHPDTAVSLNNLAFLYYSTGLYAQALPFYQRALTIREKALGPEHPETANSLNNLAALYDSTGQYAYALPLVQRALAIREKALGPEHPDTAISLNNLAELYRSTGQYDHALPLYQRALRVAQAAGSPELVWSLHGNLMTVHAPEKVAVDGSAAALPLAIWHGKQAINTLQKVRADLRRGNDEMQRSFLKKNESYYTRLAELLVEDGRIPEAEQVLAMLKERELSDLLQRSDIRKTQADEVGVERRISRENAEYAERGAKYSSELAALERKARLEPLTAAETTRKDDLLKAAQAWRDDYQRWLTGLATVFAQSGRNRGETAETGTKLQTRVRAEPGAVGLHYIVSDDRIAIIVATARGSFGRFSEIKRKDLNGQIAALRQAIVARTDPLPAAQALYKTLIAPVARDLEDAQAKTLVLSLTDTLRYVPFAALHDGNSFLIERHPLVLYASAGGGDPKASSAAWQVAALGLTQGRLGYSPLPAVRGELEGIVRSDASPQGVLPGRISLDQAFDRSQLEDALKGNFSVVHVASHFNFTAGDESRSVLLPGAGEAISLGQLAVLDFSQVQQLTLSACETATGGGANENGAEVEGLAAAVQAQGAQAVLASLWKVADASTAQLMQRFYAQRVQGQTTTRAIALQQAQIALLRGAAKDGTQTPSAERSARRDGPAGTAMTAAPADPSRPYAHPFFWAPFVLSGNWL